MLKQLYNLDSTTGSEISDKENGAKYIYITSNY